MTTLIRSLSITTALLGAFAVSACSTAPKNGVIATDMTGSLTQMWSNIFTGKLRPAPQAQYSFGSTDATLNTPQLLQRLSQQSTEQRSRQAYLGATAPQYAAENPWSRRLAPTPKFERYEDFIPRQSASVPILQERRLPPPPPRSQPVYADPFETHDDYPQDEPVQNSTVVENRSDSLSYVKIGGGSKMADWQFCESQAGGYFLTTASGFVVAPEFDVCMRSKGYLPENEAQLELAGAPS